MAFHPQAYEYFGHQQPVQLTETIDTVSFQGMCR